MGSRILAVIAIAISTSCLAQPIASGYPPTGNPAPNTVPDAAEHEKLFSAAKAQLAEVLALESDMLRAYKTADLHWYQTDLKSKPVALASAWADQMESLRLTDRYKAGVSSCGAAASSLGSAMAYRFEKPSAHYYAEYLKWYREDVDSCKSALKLSSNEYEAHLDALR